jgi:hypothetical protein
VLSADLQPIEHVLLRLLLLKLHLLRAGIIGLIGAVVVENIFFLFRTFPHISTILTSGH